MTTGRFQGMIGVLIWCPAIEKYLILKRSAEKDYGSNTWECGSGRVDQGESFSEALARETFEELGVTLQVDFILGTAHFYRGAAVPENEMIGVFYRCTLDDPDSIRLSWEHSEHRWVTAKEAQTFLPEDYWLMKLIRLAEEVRLLMPDSLLQFHRTYGFDL